MFGIPYYLPGWLGLTWPGRGPIAYEAHATRRWACSASAHIRMPLSGCKCVEGMIERGGEGGTQQLSLTRRLPKTEHTHIASHFKYISIPRPALLMSRRKSRRWAGKLTKPRGGEGWSIRGCITLPPFSLLTVVIQFAICVCARS